MDEPKGDVDWMSRLHGAAALCAFVFAGLLIGSGIGLSMSYVPSQTEAFSSELAANHVLCVGTCSIAAPQRFIQEHSP